MTAIDLFLKMVYNFQKAGSQQLQPPESALLAFTSLEADRAYFRFEKSAYAFVAVTAF